MSTDFCVVDYIWAKFLIREDKHSELMSTEHCVVDYIGTKVLNREGTHSEAMSTDHCVVDYIGTTSPHEDLSVHIRNWK